MNISSASSASSSSSCSPSCSPPSNTQLLTNSDSYSIANCKNRHLNGSMYTEWQAPYCPITLKSTKEVAGFNTISEAFYRLDFCNAIQDIRRFNYICKLLHLLITQNLTSLSGCATKVLFTLLEQVAWQGMISCKQLTLIIYILNK